VEGEEVDSTWVVGGSSVRLCKQEQRRCSTMVNLVRLLLHVL
jgi:hypothetical protein